MATRWMIGSVPMAWLLLSAASAATPLQVERVAFATGDHAAQPSVAVDPRDGFVVTWQERDGRSSTLQFAVIGADGHEQRRGTVAHGNDWFINGADFPNLAVLDNGDWVTFWLQKSSPETYSYDIRTTRSRDRGASWDPPVLLHDDGTATEHGFVSLVADGDDRVRAVWLDGRRMAGGAGAHDAHGEAAEHMTLRSASLGRDGVLRDAQELDDLTCACCQTDAVRHGEQTIVLYRDRSSAEVRDPYRIIHRDGRWSSPAVLHPDGWTIAACPVNGPAIAAQQQATAAVWPTMAGGPMRVSVQLDGTTRTLAEGDAELGRVDIVGWNEGQWLVSRVTSKQRVPNVRLSVLDPAGNVVDEQLIGDRVGGYPRLARLGDVGLLVWAQAGASAGSSTVSVALITATPGR